MLDQAHQHRSKSVTIADLHMNAVPKTIRWSHMLAKPTAEMQRQSCSGLCCCQSLVHACHGLWGHWQLSRHAPWQPMLSRSAVQGLHWSTEEECSRLKAALRCSRSCQACGRTGCAGPPALWTAVNTDFYTPAVVAEAQRALTPLSEVTLWLAESHHWLDPIVVSRLRAAMKGVAGAACCYFLSVLHLGAH